MTAPSFPPPGDKAALETFWAPNGQFRLGGDPALLQTYPTGPDAIAVLNRLIDMIRFEDLERLDAVVDGLKAAVHWRATLKFGDSPRKK